MPDALSARCILPLEARTRIRHGGFVGLGEVCG